MSFFIGWTFSATFVPRLADKYGRKIAFLGTVVVQTAALIVMNFSRTV
jgi:MFS family permease